MQFRYGTHAHPANEVNLESFEVIRFYSKRGQRYLYKNRMTISGELQYDTQSQMTAKINELVNAYAEDYKDAALYQDDGTITNHAIMNSHPDNITGTRIVARSWPVGNPAEYCTARTFRIVIEADFVDPVDQIIAFQETVRFVGGGGPRWRMFVPAVGAAFPLPLTTATPQVIIQSGSMMGMQGYPVAAPPSLIPAWLDQEKTIDDLIGPIFQGQQFAYYGREWTYTHYVPAPVPGVVPHTR